MEKQVDWIQPPCATWDVWVAPEVEGSEETGKGKRTLFIRSLKLVPAIRSEDADIGMLARRSDAKRVWFCKEFTDWKLLRKIAETFEEVCVETTQKGFTSLPLDIRNTFRIYLKVDRILKAGDVVCVGPAFGDEAFTIGTGDKVRPEDYLSDKQIL